MYLIEPNRMIYEGVRCKTSLKNVLTDEIGTQIMEVLLSLILTKQKDDIKFTGEVVSTTLNQR